VEGATFEAGSRGTSTLTWGTIRLSHLGIHQLASPRFHGRWHQHHSHDGGIDEHCGGEAESQELDDPKVT
jgi:hypothetical protein